ncbi:MAG: HmuY family protein [Bacteroidales bacterium]|nr:HmuY family protein [Bacteroidales bacterium]
MNRKIKFLGMAIIGLSLIATSCKKDETSEPVVDNTIKVSITTKNNEKVDHWVYYSFETKGEISGIDSSNFKTSDKWDIAFHSRHVRLNGGTSGAGMAEAYDAGVVDWTSVTEATESGYTKDAFADSILYAGNGQAGPIMIGTDLNMVFENAFEFDANTHPPTYLANKNVYAFKTRKGNYAKIMLTDYYNDKGVSGYISFKYVLNTDGGRDL